MRYTTLFFDLDDTLYASENGLWDAIRDRMNEYMSVRLGLPLEEIPSLRKKYYETYGTTLRGLQKFHQVDVDDFLAYVHDLPLQAFLKPEPELRAMLTSLAQRKWIFTNADAGHASRVLNIIGAADCFEGIVDIRALKFVCKPDPEAYRGAMAAAGEVDPQRCVLLDDSLRNLAPARELGFTTVLVGMNGSPAAARPESRRIGAPDSAAQYLLPRLLDLPRVMPQLWEA